VGGELRGPLGLAISWSELALNGADIVIVYYLIYRTLLLIRATRAAQMLTGIVVVGSGLFVAKHLQLGTVSWLFDYLLGHFIIVSIVVFQHDIRRALMRLGRSLLPARRRVEEGTLLEEVLGAVEVLSSANEGALIVLERDMDLGEMLEPGVEVDAVVSKQLLVSLFLKGAHNPLHDGAVLVKNLRIAQAAVLLPLSSNPRLELSLGTRHRAGIGITEETDAVAVVVSEDRGRISLCFQGNLINELTLAELRSTLRTLFGQTRT
jgi:uncharacterized protein (TIGR00159 family)